jgi:hypothetical protein
MGKYTFLHRVVQLNFKNMPVSSKMPFFLGGDMGTAGSPHKAQLALGEIRGPVISRAVSG